MRRYLAGAEEIAREDFLVRWDVRRHANDREFVQSALHPRHRLVPVTAPRDHLREERVVIRRDLIALEAVRVEADTRPRGRKPAREHTRRRSEVRLGVLGIDAALDGVAVNPDLLLAE